MEENNKSYRIRTKVGEDTYVNFKLDQDYDILEILSLKIGQKNAYKLHTSDYGIVAGRVLANGGFGIPNTKISIFIPSEEVDESTIVKMLYPYENFTDKNKDGIAYNLLPDSKVSNCHTVIGTFPSKRFTLDNDTVLEVYEKYYKYTTKTNNSGDYMLFGVPVGNYNIHSDIDLSDIGILSQRPRDMIYKGYNINQFENPNKFKSDTNLSNLTQVISQNKTVEIKPFWGEESENIVGITRCDIDVNYKFEPTCVFMGSVVSDSASNGISKKCIPTKNMGAMDELTTGSGTIEMIRKKTDGTVEEFQVQGTQVINGDGVWCYQIPMNLDYMMTDEYGNMAPTDDPNKGIATRTRVRFRLSLQDFDTDNTNIIRSKMLIPNNPKNGNSVDYQFGTNTSDDSYRDLFWNGVYSVKSYIPRLQKGSKWRSNKFSGIKRTNYFNSNNPIPYNNIRIKIPFMYTMICSIIKVIIWFISLFNRLIQAWIFNRNKRTCMYLSGELCPEFDDLPRPWYFAPRCGMTSDNKPITRRKKKNKNIPDWVHSEINNTRDEIYNNEIGKAENDSGNIDAIDYFPGPGGATDKTSIDYRNKETLTGSYVENFVLSSNISYFVHCIEMNLAEEYRVIQFDFYNDWINGMIYLPRWMRQIRKKKSFLFGLIKINGKVKACNENSDNRINIVQQCSLEYDKKTNGVITSNGCHKKKFKCHKAEGMNSFEVLNSIHRGLVTSQKTFKGQYVYYFKPIEYVGNKKVNLFATDVILLGTLNDCDRWGIPNSFSELRSSTYQLPNNNVLVNRDYDTEEYSNDIENYTSDSKGETIRINSTGPFPENGDDGYFTEMSGIDWGISGPYQNIQKDGNPLFRPGGHFLGLSCSESETSIVSCINLSRICEHGVWMSQRQEYEYPSDIDIKNGAKIIKYNSYSVNPTGVIAKDEISDTNYRSVFASLNHNGLKTIIDNKTGYPVYDFKYIYPTIFAGELNSRLKNEYNVEKLKYIQKNGLLSSEQDGEIRRTNDEKDKEYIKFRFGIDNDDTEGNNREKKFLKNYYNSNSMPVYENSFYFYFGLHDGNTALDEFKRQYYSVCENNDDLLSEKTELYVKASYIQKYDKGYCEKSGYYSFNLEENSKDIFPLSYYCINNNGKFINKYGKEDKEENSTFSVEYDDKNKKIEYKTLDVGKYSIIFTTSNMKTDRYNFTIDNVSYSSDIYKTDFKINIEDINDDYQKVFEMDHIKNGGYIALMGNSIRYNDDVIPVFAKNSNGEWEVSNSVDIYAVYSDGNVDNYIVFKGGRKENQTKKYVINNLVEDESGNVIIPLIKGNARYKVYVSVNTNYSCEVTGDPSRWRYATDVKLWETEINFPEKLDFLFNGISHRDYLSSINGFDTESNMNLNDGLRFKVKQMIMKVDDSPLNINVELKGGYAPYTENYKGQYEVVSENNNIISLAPISGNEPNIRPFDEINIPTKYYDGFKRDDFEYSITDANGIDYPNNSVFKFPILFKPFFANIVIVKHMNDEKYYIAGQIYNGITLDYQYDNFNVVTLNGNSISNSCKIEYDDLYSNDEYDMTESDFSSLPKTLPTTNNFKLKSRKTYINKELNPSIYGLDSNIIPKVEFTIGTESDIYNSENDSTESVSCLTDLASLNNKFYNIEFSYVNGEIIADISNIPNNLVKKITDLSLYPFENGAINNEKIEKIMYNFIHDIEYTNNSNGTNDAFYVILSNEYKNEKNFRNSNKLSKFNLYSISNIYKISEMEKWFPMEFNFSFMNKNKEGESYKYFMNIDSRNETMKDKLSGKRVIFKFYNDAESIIPLGSVEAIFDENGSATDINISSIDYMTTKSSGDIFIDYDIYAYGNGPQPFKYKKQKEHFEWEADSRDINTINFGKVINNPESQNTFIMKWSSDYALESQLLVTIYFERNGEEMEDELFIGDSEGEILLSGEDWIWGESASSIKIDIEDDEYYHYKLKY